MTEFSKKNCYLNHPPVNLQYPGLYMTLQHLYIIWRSYNYPTYGNPDILAVHGAFIVLNQDTCITKNCKLYQQTSVAGVAFFVSISVEILYLMGFAFITTF